MGHPSCGEGEGVRIEVCPAQLFTYQWLRGALAKGGHETFHTHDLWKSASANLRDPEGGLLSDSLKFLTGGWSESNKAVEERLTYFGGWRDELLVLENLRKAEAQAGTKGEQSGDALIGYQCRRSIGVVDPTRRAARRWSQVLGV